MPFLSYYKLNLVHNPKQFGINSNDAANDNWALLIFVISNYVWHASNNEADNRGSIESKRKG